jgi:hypothetical protein
MYHEVALKKQTISWFVLLQVSEIWSLASFIKHTNKVESSACSMNMNKDHELYMVIGDRTSTSLLLGWILSLWMKWRFDGRGGDWTCYICNKLRGCGEVQRQKLVDGWGRGLVEITTEPLHSKNTEEPVGRDPCVLCRAPEKSVWLEECQDVEAECMYQKNIRCRYLTDRNPGTDTRV